MLTSSKGRIIMIRMEFGYNSKVLQQKIAVTSIENVRTKEVQDIWQAEPRFDEKENSVG